MVSNQTQWRSRGLLAMTKINHIKTLRNHEDVSINEIANRAQVNWRTAKKYADEEQVPKEKQMARKGMMYEEHWGEIVTDWLIEDRKLKPKLRRKNKTIFQQLQGHGFEGSYRTVCYFIAEWKEGKNNSEEIKDKNSERLNHPPAEAQVDFGITEAVKDGKFIDVHCLVMSLPYSNTALTVPLPGENQECFLYGLKKIFERLGGVPRKLRIDNLKAAVIKARDKDGEAIFTDEFLQFANFYRFEIQACNVRKGNEKGHVENKVGYVRYNFVTPSPIIESYEDLTNILNEKLVQDRQRIHYSKEVRIQELLDEEMNHALALPEEDYPIFKETKVTANKYGEITIDSKKEHIPKGYNFSYLHLVLYWDRYKVVSPYGEILHSDFRPYMNKSRNIPWLSIMRAWASKPRSVPYSRYNPYLPGRIAAYLNIESLTLRKERLHWLISLLINHDMEEINERFYDLLQHQSERISDSTSHPYDVDWSKYDLLQPSAKEDGEQRI